MNDINNIIMIICKVPLASRYEKVRDYLLLERMTRSCNNYNRRRSTTKYYK